MEVVLLINMIGHWIIDSKIANPIYLHSGQTMRLGVEKLGTQNQYTVDEKYILGREINDKNQIN